MADMQHVVGKPLRTELTGSKQREKQQTKKKRPLHQSFEIIR